jgi:hypothetical protein
MQAFAAFDLMQAQLSAGQVSSPNWALLQGIHVPSYIVAEIAERLEPREAVRLASSCRTLSWLAPHTVQNRTKTGTFLQQSAFLIETFF